VQVSYIAASLNRNGERHHREVAHRRHAIYSHTDAVVLSYLSAANPAIHAGSPCTGTCMMQSARCWTSEDEAKSCAPCFTDVWDACRYWSICKWCVTCRPGYKRHTSLLDCKHATTTTLHSLDSTTKADMGAVASAGEDSAANVHRMFSVPAQVA